jgi:hypothetical protein
MTNWKAGHQHAPHVILALEPEKRIHSARSEPQSRQCCCFGAAVFKASKSSFNDSTIPSLSFVP